MPTLAGHLDLTCARDVNGRSYLREQSFSAPFHISKPYWDGDALLLQLASPTPGLFGGDRLTSSVTLDEGARLRIITPSAGRAHTMNGDGAELRQTFRLAKGARLEFCPAPFIPQRLSRYKQTANISIDEGGELLLLETIAPGRVAHGESFRYKAIDWECNVTYAGRLVLRERFVLEPNSPAFAAMKQPFPQGYYASACIISEAACEDDSWVEEINAIQSDDIRIGASCLVAAGWSIKLLATDSLALQRATAQLRQALTRFFPAQDHQSRIFGFNY